MNFDNVPCEDDWSFAGYKPSETSKWSHGYHRYPAKFIPQLVEKIFDDYINKRTDVVIDDPFMGCGTTIVTAISRGYIAYGTDINKIAYYITKAKATPINPNHLHQKIERFKRKIHFLKPGGSSQTLSKFLGNKGDIDPLIPQEHLERIDYWFPEVNKIKLGKILRVITNEEDEIIKNFFYVAFSNILKSCSVWLQKSTKPTRDRKKTPIDPYTAIVRQLKKMERGNAVFYKVVPPTVINNINDYLRINIGDARNQSADSNTVDLVITSSPYVTSYEYADLHQLSTIWFNFTSDLKEYRKKFIGTAYKETSTQELKSITGNNIVNEMSRKNKKLANEIRTFFIDMQEVINESYRILRDDGRACYVIGNTTLKQVRILNAEVFAELMKNSGFEIKRVIKREIPSKILPQKRDSKTGRFAKATIADTVAYPHEFIIIGIK